MDRNAYMREWSRQHPENRRKAQRKYYETNREKLLAEKKKYNEKYKQKPDVKKRIKKYNEVHGKKRWIKESEKLKRQHKKYYEENKEKVLNSVSSYRKTFKGKFVHNKSNVKRRIKLLNAKVIGSHTAEEWKQKLKESEGYCFICDKYFGIENLTKDHIIPLSHPTGSSDNIKNIQAVCKKCNSSKGGFRNV